MVQSSVMGDTCIMHDSGPLMRPIRGTPWLFWLMTWFWSFWMSPIWRTSLLPIVIALFSRSLILFLSGARLWHLLMGCSLHYGEPHMKTSKVFLVGNRHTISRDSYHKSYMNCHHIYWIIVIDVVFQIRYKRGQVWTDVQDVHHTFVTRVIPDPSVADFRLLRPIVNIELHFGIRSSALDVISSLTHCAH